MPLVSKPVRRMLMLLAGCTPGLIFAQRHAVQTVQAELLAPLDTRHLAAGSPVLVQTVTPFQGAHCELRAGTVVEGRVATIASHKKGAARSEIGLLFHPAACSASERVSLVLSLAAVRAPITEPQMRSLNEDALGDAMVASIASHSPEGGASAAVLARPMGDRLQPISNLRAEAPLRAGDVAGLHDVKLLLPTATDEPALLFSPHDFSLGRHVRLFLVATEAAATTAAAVPATAVAEKSPAPVTPVKAETAAASAPLPAATPVSIPDETELCVEPRCSIVSTVSPVEEAQAQTVLPLAPWGYLNRSKRRIDTLDDDAAVAFLGNDELLMTFNPHLAITRSGQEAASGVQPRVIRAVVFRLRTGKVARTVDWRVTNPGPYLWELNNGQVLAHVGNTLSIYGSGLTLEHRMALQGPLQFVSVSPSRRLLAAGVLRERHSPAMHRKLQDLVGEGRSVEEDLQLTVMSSELEPQHEMTLNTEVHAPVLLDSGEVFTDPAGPARWMLIERTWDGNRHTLTQVKSDCEPAITTMAEEMLFVMGCEPKLDNTWYRLMTAAGATVLKGNSINPDMVGYAGGQTGGGLFAIGISHVAKRGFEDAYVHGDDLTGITVSVYRSSDGKRVFATDTPAPAPSRQNFALSPGGDRLAVVAAGAVRLYAVHATPEQKPGSETAHAAAK